MTITLYENVNYGGASRNIDTEPNFINLGWNDKVSSVKVTNGAYLLFDDCYGGGAVHLVSSTGGPTGNGLYPTFQGYFPNDAISSCYKVPDVNDNTFESLLDTWGIIKGAITGPGISPDRRTVPNGVDGYPLYKVFRKSGAATILISSNSQQIKNLDSGHWSNDSDNTNTFHINRNQTSTSTASYALTTGFKTTTTFSEKITVGDKELGLSSESSYSFSFEESFSSTDTKTQSVADSWILTQDLLEAPRSQGDWQWTVMQSVMDGTITIPLILSGYVPIWFDGKCNPSDRNSNDLHYLWFLPVGNVISEFKSWFPAGTKLGNQYNVNQYNVIDNNTVQVTLSGNFHGVKGLRSEFTNSTKPLAAAASAVTTRVLLDVHGHNTTVAGVGK